MNKKLIAIFLGAAFAAFAWWFFLERPAESAPIGSESVAQENSF